MAATEHDLTVAKQKILTTWIDEEGLADAVQCYPILYDKSMKGFKDQKKKETPIWGLQQVSPAPFFTLPYVVMLMFTLPT